MANQRFVKLSLCVVIFEVLTTACSGPAEPVPAPQPAISTQLVVSTRVPTREINSEVISPDELFYLGAFRLPEDGTREQDMFSWGGEALAYNPNNDSLFIVGHAWHINVAEISIPELRTSLDVAELAQAEIIQPFTDIKGRVFTSWTLEIPRVGLEVLDDRLFFCIGEHLEEDTTKGTHGFTTLDLAPASKACVVGDVLYATNDYLFKIPPVWQSAFGGANLLTGRFRDGGWSGQGPSLFAIASDDIVTAGADERIPAMPVVHYDTSYFSDAPQDAMHIMDNYSHADSWTGGAFIQAGETSAVVILGTHGWGNTWYGFSNGVVYPTDGDEDSVYPDVPPYPHDARGWWNDDFRATMLMYDPSEMADVVAGKLDANVIQPYAFVDLSEYMLVVRDETAMQYLGGIAYDDAHGILYVLELFADGDKPVVHAFEVDQGDTE